MKSSTPNILWHPDPEARHHTHLGRFWDLAEQRTDRAFPDYPALHRWSVQDPDTFWGLCAEFAGINFLTGPDRVKGPDLMPGTSWFSGARLNYAENLLYRRDDHLAIIALDETGATRSLSFSALHQEVAACATALRAMGVVPGDCVAAFIANVPETVIAFLACASIGAIWSSCSPDFGPAAAADRFQQIEPKVLFATDRYFYGGKEFDCRPTLGALRRAIPGLEKTILVPYAPHDDISPEPGCVWWDDFRNPDAVEIEFAPLPFDHPLYILYSSGTTGAPKCMVHGAGGSLIQHRKEHQLHTDLGEDDTVLYLTTCGWMMWNWLISALAGGSTIVLYEGNPGHPALNSMWRLAADLEVSCFGTSAPFIDACMRAGLSPRDFADLSHLTSVLSTGAPLSPAGFRWVHERVGAHVRLSSISGGTDIVSCFVLGNPLLPVYEGEIQCLGLGMDVASLDDSGDEIFGQKGELVCRTPFPSMPVKFWNDPDGAKYHDAYFTTYPGLWHHGDFIEVSDRGTVIIHGRSDSTLKPGGVRIGTTEIYRPLQVFDWITGAVAAALTGDSGDQVVLFVSLTAGENLTADRIAEIKSTIRGQASPRHSPRQVLQVGDVPRTRNGKVAESAVARVLNGEVVTNRDSLANPECLADFVAARKILLARGSR
jgi:acetoacetyl-CoA synthetase